MDKTPLFDRVAPWVFAGFLFYLCTFGSIGRVIHNIVTSIYMERYVVDWETAQKVHGQRVRQEWLLRQELRLTNEK